MREFSEAGKRFLALDVPGGAAYVQTRGLGAKRLEWWGQGIADCGGASLDEAESAATLWAQIDKLARGCAGARLEQIDASSPLVTLARGAGWTVLEAETCPSLQFPSYIRRLRFVARKNYARTNQALSETFGKTVRCALRNGAIARGSREFLDDLFLLHGKRWRARGQTGVLALPARRRFHREVCARFFEEGWLRLWRLKCDGRAACVLLCYSWGGKYWFFIGGFEPELMRWSVGTCLFARVFKTAIDEGATEFDFLRGAEEYKYRFGAVDRPFVSLEWFAPTPRGKWLSRRVALEAAFRRKMHERFSAAAH
jgi:CelD/BcsL family acetyltransferase involved in cellulose biosynthesis